MRDLALALFVMGVIPIALVRPVVGLFLWTGFSYMNPHRLTWGFAYSFPWVYLAAVVTLFSLVTHPKECQKLPWRGLTILLLVFLAWTGITSLTAIQPDAAQTKWVEFFKIQLMILTTLVLVVDRRRLYMLLWVIVVSFGFWGLKSGVFTLLTGGRYHVFGPARSFFEDNNQFALVMCMTLPLMRHLQLQATHKWVRRGFWVLMGFTVLSVLGTYSRGGFLALAATLLMLTLKSRRRAGVLIVFIMLIPLFLSFMPAQWTERMHTISHGDEVNSLDTRIQSWVFAANVALAKPVTGGGFQVWSSSLAWAKYGPEDAKLRAIHSIFFEVLGEQGFVGLALFLGLLVVGWQTLARIRRNARGSPETQWMADLASMLQVSLVGYVVAGAALPMPYFDFFYQILALTVILQVLLHAETVKAAKTPRLYSGAGSSPAYNPAFFTAERLGSHDRKW